jgi:type I restriction enzyme M protein
VTTAGLDLISMADIARLAGQSRSTVGNWKLRNPDFPNERGRGTRGPLYDRSEVVHWLTATNRVEHRPPHLQVALRISDVLRKGMETEEALQLILVLLALMLESSPEDWRDLQSGPPSEADRALRARVRLVFPYAEILLPLSSLPGQLLAEVIAMVSEIDRNVVGRAMDAVLERAAVGLSLRGGEYTSPRSVRQLIVALAGPSGSVYNPASGLGQLMVDLADQSSSPVTAIHGQEINERIRAMARLNLAIHGVRAEVASGDVFSADAFPGLRAERVVAVPPWGQKLAQVGGLADDPRWVWGEPGSADGNAAWIQHCLYHLADDGRAVVVVPNGALFEGGRAGRIRQRIIKAGLLDAVIALPPGLFRWTSISSAVLVFSKARSRDGGMPGPTLMIDVSQRADGAAGRHYELSSDVIESVSRMYREWVTGTPVAAANATVASFDQLATNDFVIDPGRYMPIDSAPENPGDARRTRDDLLRELSGLKERCRLADDRLAEILGVDR